MIGVNVDAIDVAEDRFRKVYDEKAMADLQGGIQRVGLLHPPTVERGEDGRFNLRAGARRLRACKAIVALGLQIRCGDNIFPLGTIPAVDYRELTPLERLEIEVEENVFRADFGWKERTAAIAALHELRKKQNPEHTIRATASEVLGKDAVGGQQTSVSNSLTVAKHLNNPEVAKAKSEKEALKIIEKQAQAAHRAKLAIQYEAVQINHKVIHGDSREELGRIAAGSYDVILADPPYGVGADSFGDMSGHGHQYVDSAKNFEALCEWLPDELSRVAKAEAHCYLFCDERNFDRLSTLMCLAGWTVFPRTMIWDKCGTGMLPFPDNGPRVTHERILYAWKGDKRTLVVKNDVLRVNAVKKLLHGAQKPVALYCDLLSRSANPGDTVLDCFGGSGTILVAANRLRLTATYIEMDEKAYHIALQRVNESGFDDGAEEDDGIEIAI